MADELTLEMIQTTESKFQSQYDRMDISEKLYFLEKFTLMNLEDSQPTPNVMNVTLNDPKTYAKKAISALTKAEQVWDITSKRVKDDLAPIEEFGDHALTEIDARLTNMGEVELYPTQCERVCIRGSIAGRVGIRAGKDGTVIWDVVPWDTRFFSFATAPDGMTHASYRTTKTKEMIAFEHGMTVKDEEVEMRNVLTRQKEIIYINDVAEKTMTHGLGYVPVIFAGSSSGTTLKTTDRSGDKNDDIYSSVRDLYEQLNICATVLQTMNLMSFKRPLQYESDAGERAKLPKKPPYGVGAVTAVEKGGGFKTMPLEDVMSATRMIWGILEQRIERGSFTTLDYGSTPFPMSAVGIAKLTGEKDEIFIPRLQALAIWYQKLLRMIIKQVTLMDLKPELGQMGAKKLWTPADLAGDYNIDLHYYAMSPEQNIANYSVAAAAGETVSMRYKRAEIIKLKNPQAMEDEVNSELADKLIPSLRLYKLAKSKLKLGQTVEATLIANQMGLTIEQVKSGKLEGEGGQDMNSTEHDGEALKTPPSSDGKQLIPLLDKSTNSEGKTSEKEASELSAKLGVSK